MTCHTSISVSIIDFRSSPQDNITKLDIQVRLGGDGIHEGCRTRQIPSIYGNFHLKHQVAGNSEMVMSAARIGVDELKETIVVFVNIAC